MAMPGTRTARERCRVCQCKCSGDHHCETIRCAAAEQMREHASSRSSRLRHPDRKREQTGSWVRQAARAMEEPLKEDQQELEAHERQRKVEDAKRICRIFRENDKNKDLSHVQSEMGKLMRHDEQELLSVWEGWHWDDNKGGWLDPELCAKARREEVEYIRRHTMCTGVSRETCLRERGRAPIKTGWAETDKGPPGKPNVHARWVAKEYKTHARPELYASTPPLEALKIVLSEIATGKRGRKVVALIDVRVLCARTYRCCLPHMGHACKLYKEEDAQSHNSGLRRIFLQRCQARSRTMRQQPQPLLQSAQTMRQS